MYTAKPAPPRASALKDYPYDALDDLLYDWACWERMYSATRGFSAVDKTCAAARSSRQWQTTDEILDAGVFAWQMEQVEACVDELGSSHQLAIRVEMMNRQGPAVWRNPRAPVRQQAVYAEAKAAIRPILERRGVEIGC
ncbi:MULTISPECIES: hypothetical protein [Ralstonia solanacearum species complex]|uniref:hypothetical protein n=1 Tax=Ralstonia solanacearum species complex TaxID=3116862 RepID=UPI0008F94CAE|nr:hypothetical protein [Ralstonia pseudosolanacearum]MCK4125457.1 hypothetical protein [Ralstonia pseudosolanacearum]MCK4164291.1 hypothetical protein [Ralstonia pseudosolanacearum]OIN72500.1 hypothetical protein BL248_15980 [Ralstonia solanacearum]